MTTNAPSSQLLRAAETGRGGGDYALVDARKGGCALMDEITARGLDIDEGMVVKVGNDLHYGSDAIFELGAKQIY